MNLTNQTNDRLKKAPVIAAGIALALCLAAVVIVHFNPYDPAIPSDGETIFDYCLVSGVWLLPVSSICFAKRLFEGRRFRFALSWLVGFLIPWSLFLCEIFFPRIPSEGSCCTNLEVCLYITIVIATITGAINVADSLARRLLCGRWNAGLRFAAWFPLTILLSALILACVFGILLALKLIFD